uniref:Potassium channel domain-containing protein n=1 Tax=Clytia hemisphaerica TaxID=252671 RepID=A0A7M5WYM0_9CNID
EQWNDSNIFELTKMCEEVVVITDDRRCAYDANNFAHYLDYTYSIAFTIGFGHVVPYSDLGKIVTMLYALPAVGLTLVLYSYAADILIMVTYLVTAKIEKRFLNKIRICKYKTTMVQVFLSIFGFFGMSIILMLEGERKTLDNFYLCFISLTTIGFGDIIYSSKDSLKNPWIYVPQLIVFLFTMATVASTLSAVSELLKKNKLGKWFSKKRHVNKSKINDKKSTKRHSDGYTTA